ncbi:hypothetical protein [Helcococcus bovis]|uniref:hypothetical protein n=1 Tax=Helcococcus bovis TaxID=3153252 RepID=UPI0038B78073
MIRKTLIGFAVVSALLYKIQNIEALKYLALILSSGIVGSIFTELKIKQEDK